MVLPRLRVPSWQRELLMKINTTDYLSLSIVTSANDDLSQKLAARLFRVWKRIDQKFFRNKLPGGRSSEDLVEINPDDIVAGDKVRTSTSLESISDDVIANAPDVVVWLIRNRPPIALVGCTRYGIWTLPNAVNESTGFRELVGRIPVTSCKLTSLGADPAGDQLLSAAFASTDPLSLSRGLRAVRAKDQTLLMAMLRHVYRAGAPAAESPAQVAQECPKAPGAFYFLWGLAKLYARYSQSLITRRFFYNHWQIAYRRGGDRLSQEGLHSFAPDHKGFWADPFVVSWRGRTALFFEEMPEGEHRGKIVVSEFQEDGTPGLPKTIVERDYHLSYPFLFDYEGELFMTPESAEANRIEAYRCVEFPGKWEPYAVLLNGVRAYDPTLIEYNGRWWMFVSIEDNGNSSADELHLFYAADPFSEWNAHPMNPVSGDVRSARPAGALYWRNGELYRPAQDCSVRYGYALSIQKILRMSEDSYEEEEVGRILPDWAPHSLGTHTVNQAAGITVYDSFTRRRK